MATLQLCKCSSMHICAVGMIHHPPPPPPSVWRVYSIWYSIYSKIQNWEFAQDPVFLIYFTLHQFFLLKLWNKLNYNFVLLKIQFTFSLFLLNMPIFIEPWKMSISCTCHAEADKVFELHRQLITYFLQNGMANVLKYIPQSHILISACI